MAVTIPIKVNLGCGAQVVPGWVNVDYSLGARLATKPLARPVLRRLHLFDIDWDPSILVHDLRRRLPWEDGSVDVCYTSHTLEHLSRDEGRATVREVFRVLRPGGVFRVIVPDLRAVIDRYVAGELPAEDVVEQLGVLQVPGKTGLKKTMAPWIEFPHTCMYDDEAMVRLLSGAGFDATPRGPFESDIDDIRAVEIEDRTVDAVIVEGRKPA